MAAICLPGYAQSCNEFVSDLRRRDMFTHMAFDQFLHQPADRAAHGGDKLERGGAIGLAQQLPFDVGDLPGDAANPVQQLLPVCNKMSHSIPPYPISIVSQGPYPRGARDANGGR